MGLEVNVRRVLSIMVRAASSNTLVLSAAASVLAAGLVLAFAPGALKQSSTTPSSGESSLALPTLALSPTQQPTLRTPGPALASPTPRPTAGVRTTRVAGPPPTVRPSPTIRLTPPIAATSTVRPSPTARPSATPRNH